MPYTEPGTLPKKVVALILDFREIGLMLKIPDNDKEKAIKN